MFVSKASRYAFRISHNVYFDNQLKTGKDRVVSSSALALSTVGILLSAFGLRQMGHNQKWIERGWRHRNDTSLNNPPTLRQCSPCPAHCLNSEAQHELYHHCIDSQGLLVLGKLAVVAPISCIKFSSILYFWPTWSVQTLQWVMLDLCWINPHLSSYFCIACLNFNAVCTNRLWGEVGNHLCKSNPRPCPENN